MSYNIIIGSQFKPFSYQELALPLMQATQVHDTIGAAFGTLEEEAGKWEMLAESSTDRETYKRYKDYSDALRIEADKLAQNGLTNSSRRSLMDMKTKYNQQILPIEMAFKKRVELANGQNAQRLKDGSIRFDRDAKDISLEELIKNPMISYNAQSMNELTAKAATMATQLKNEVLDPTQAQEWIGILGDTYYQQAITHGISSDELMQFLHDAASRGNTAAGRKLQSIYALVKAGSNIRNWENSSMYEDQEDAAIFQGLFGAINTTKYQQVQNWALQDQMRRAAAASAAGTQEPILQAPNLSYGMFPATQTDVERAQLWRDWEGKDGYIQYNPKTGVMELTEEGIKQYNKERKAFNIAEKEGDIDSGIYFDNGNGKYYKQTNVQGTYALRPPQAEITKEEFYRALGAYSKQNPNSFRAVLDSTLRGYLDTLTESELKNAGISYGQNISHVGETGKLTLGKAIGGKDAEKFGDLGMIPYLRYPIVGGDQEAYVTQLERDSEGKIPEYRSKDGRHFSPSGERLNGHRLSELAITESDILAKVEEDELEDGKKTGVTKQFWTKSTAGSQTQRNSIIAKNAEIIKAKKLMEKYDIYQKDHKTDKIIALLKDSTFYKSDPTIKYLVDTGDYQRAYEVIQKATALSLVQLDRELGTLYTPRSVTAVPTNPMQDIR